LSALLKRTDRTNPLQPEEQKWSYTKVTLK
jgi:hypothetical protein